MVQRELLGLICNVLAFLGSTLELEWYPYDADSWASGEGHYEVCRKGRMQSPVELPLCEARNRPAIKLNYRSHAIELMNNGHTVQLTLHDEHTQAYHPAFMEVGGATYKLLQCHFHWGSEHTIGGLQQDMVAHCVHMKDAAGREMRFGVLAIFYEVGAVADPFLRLFEDKLPQAPSDDAHGEPTLSSYNGPVNFDLAYKGLNLSHYWTYPGSLTTPPCTEAVDWFPLMTKQVISRDQYDKFKKAIGWQSAGGNYRPPQWLNGRLIDGCKWGYQAPRPGMYKPRGDWYPYDSRTWASDVGRLSNDVCSRGMMQSPVELPVCEAPATRQEINIDWGSHAVELLNNGHTVQLTLNDTDKTHYRMIVGDATYKLIQCHFHWGSEHTIGNKQQDMVAHCVHVKRAKGRELRFGVLAIFYIVGEEADPFLASFDDHLPHFSTSTESHRRLSGKVVANFTGPVNFNLAWKGLDLSHYWTYPGSLTTPPCTEAVDWFPLMQRRVMSAEQHAKFKAAIGWTVEGGNFRPPQLLHGRKIAGCQEDEPTTGTTVKEEDTNWLMTGGLVVAIIVIAAAVCAGLAYYMHSQHKRKLAYAMPEGLPHDTPIVIRRTSKDGFIDEFESSNKLYSRGQCEKTKKPMWLVSEVQRFARQISPALGDASNSLMRQITPTRSRGPSKESGKSLEPSKESGKSLEPSIESGHSPASNEMNSSPSPSTLTPTAQETQEHQTVRFKIDRPQPVQSQPERSLLADRLKFDLSCFIPLFCQAKRPPALTIVPAQVTAAQRARADVLGKRDVESQIKDAIIGA